MDHVVIGRNPIRLTGTGPDVCLELQIIMGIIGAIRFRNLPVDAQHFFNLRRNTTEIIYKPFDTQVSMIGDVPEYMGGGNWVN